METAAVVERVLTDNHVRIERGVVRGSPVYRLLGELVVAPGDTVVVETEMRVVLRHADIQQ